MTNKEKELFAENEELKKEKVINLYFIYGANLLALFFCRLADF